ncbi:SAV_2336 N-terminal domain-related protein [Streptomyces sp. NPDC029004]|uniref:SAV_2336 N-terminal domain-related protein n=1 Tax=Streptomyces sp. NPDC029004 TaxID=3154490 RepID=UPI00340169BB
MIEELLAALVESGADAGPEELADILWLAAHIGADAETNPAARSHPSHNDEKHPLPGGEPDLPAHGGAPSADRYYNATTKHEGSEADPAARRGEAVRVRAATTLENPLGVMRALRPLARRTVPGTAMTELDEERTVTTSVEQRMVVPVLKPQRGRWLDLALVIDTHHSMLLWHNLVTELRRTITQTGIFRDVRIWFLGGTETPGTPAVTRTHGGEPRHPREVADPSGHRLVLVVTDLVTDGWKRPETENVLRQWATYGPLAVLNVLPRRLWSRGAVTTAGVLVRAARPAAPTTTWRQTRPHHAKRPRMRNTAQGQARLENQIAIPVVEASPTGLETLASLVAGGGRWSRMSCLTIKRSGTATTADTLTAPPGPTHPPAPDATRALRLFQENASPFAQKLAGYLSAVPLTLPVMTLVRRAMLPHSQHGHLAEIALGGLFAPWHDDHHLRDMDSFEFEFLPGVREALLGSQLRNEITAVQELVRREVAQYVEQRTAGPGGDFPAIRTTSSRKEGTPVGARAIPFAQALPTRAAPQAAAAESLGPGTRGQRKGARLRLAFKAAGGAVAMASVPVLDGQTYLATYSPDGTVRTWDPEDGSMVQEPFTLGLAGTSAIAAVPNGKGPPFLATINPAGEVNLWDSTHGNHMGIRYAIRKKVYRKALVYDVVDRRTEIASMAELPSIGQPPLLATTDYEGTIQIWDAMRGSRVAGPYRTGSFRGRALTVLPDVNGTAHLATADYSGTVLTWNLGSRALTPRELFTIHPQKVLAMAAIHRPGNHSLLATIGYDDVIRIWDPLTKSLDSGGALLTARELEVARVVARGASNREAARDLHMPVKTVANHLTNIYAKLGLRSRVELAHRLGDTVWDSPAGSLDAEAELTGQELRVARLVAGGATNHEAARELLLSVRTIEYLLANIYTKLGIHSRVEVARRLSGTRKSP